MTPAARFAAAIVVLDQIAAGAPAERVLTNWARGNRFAGSGDRAAIRDHVYDVLRAQRSLAARGGGTDGRALILGLLRRDGIDPATVFGAGGHAPPALTDAEDRAQPRPMTEAEAADLPDWLWPLWQDALGAAAAPAAKAQQHRADIYLRVNLRRCDRPAAQAALLADEIDTELHPAVTTALRVLSNPRRVAASDAYRNGLVEVQDAASQIAVARLPLIPGARVLDYCAGGGGKALAIADRMSSGGGVWAHDIDAARMVDLPVRAARAGVAIALLRQGQCAAAGPFDLVLCDAPCSGSGTWRRSPDAKWQLTPDRLAQLQVTQDSVLDHAAALTAPDGVLAYATCSVLHAENGDRIAAFQARQPGWRMVDRLVLHPGPDHDGFFLVLLTRS